MLKKVILFFILICCSGIGFGVVNINDCTTTQILNVSGETYLVTGNLSTITTCLDIQADHITLDCQGYTITGDGGYSDYGIKINGEVYDYNNVSNCDIDDFGSGVYLSSGDFNKFENLTLNSTVRGFTFGNDPAETILKNVELKYLPYIQSIISSFIYFDNVVDFNGKNILSFKDQSLYIDGWTNISFLFLQNTDNSTIKNLNITGFEKSGSFIYSNNMDNSNITNISLNAFYKPIIIYNGIGNILNKISILNSTYALNLNNYHFGFLSNLNFDINSGGLYLTSSQNNQIENLSINFEFNTCGGCSGLNFQSNSNDNSVINFNIVGNIQGYGLKLVTSKNNYFLNGKLFNNYVDLSNRGYSSILDCNNEYLNLTDNFDKIHFYSNSSVFIDAWTNLSSISLCNADNSVIKNLIFNNKNQVGTPLYLNEVDNSNISNISVFNYSNGIFLYDYPNNNNLYDLNLLYNTYGFRIEGSSIDNFIFNSTIILNSNHDLFFANSAKNNIFYNNFLENRIYNSNWGIIPQFFNYTLPSGLNIGNYWPNFTCIDSIINGSYEICNSPNNYTINVGNNIYDFAPLVLPSIDVSYISFEEGNYYSENVYLEVNASKDISTCTLFWNGVGFPMTVSADVCYVTKSGVFGNSYDYNVSVVGVNTATSLTETKSVNLIDSNVSYVSPTPVDGLNKYNLSNFTILFNDGGLSIDDCIFIIDGVSYSNVPVGGFCNYTYLIFESNLSKKVIEFEGFYNVSGVVTGVGKRTIKSYSDSSVESLIVPGFGVGSLVAFVVLLFFGGLF